MRTTPHVLQLTVILSSLERNLAAYEQLARLVPNLEYKLTHTTEPVDLVDFYNQVGSR